MCSIKGWYFKWCWRTLTRFSRSRHFWSWISQKWCILGTKLLRNTDRKPYYRMLPLSMTLSELWPRFQGHYIFWCRISWKGRVWKTKLLLHNRKLGMVLCLLTSSPRLTAKRVAPADIISWASCLLNVHPRNWNSHPCAKFDRNQIIHGWDMEIKPSAISNLLWRHHTVS